MNKKIIALFMTFIIVLSSCTFVMAADTTIRVNLTIGVGETKSLSNYMKSTAKVSSWSNNNPKVVVTTKDGIKGLSAGNAVVSGTSGGYTYEFNVRVLKNFTGYKNISNSTQSNQKKNSRGETITYHERYISMGTKDSISLTNLLGNDKSYYNYKWVFSDKNIIEFKGGRVKALKSGIVHLTAVSNTSSEKNHIYDFYITVSEGCVAKNISVRKETLTNLGNYLGDDVNNFVFGVVSINGSSVSIKDNQYISAPNTTNGVSILTAESTNGGVNYTYIVKIIG